MECLLLYTAQTGWAARCVGIVNGLDRNPAVGGKTHAGMTNGRVVPGGGRSGPTIHRMGGKSDGGAVREYEILMPTRAAAVDGKALVTVVAKRKFEAAAASS